MTNNFPFDPLNSGAQRIADEFGDIEKEFAGGQGHHPR